MRILLCLIYIDSPAKWQTWEKLGRNAEIYRRYLTGEDSVVLGCVFGLLDRRVISSNASGNVASNEIFEEETPFSEGSFLNLEQPFKKAQAVDQVW